MAVCSCVWKWLHSILHEAAPICPVTRLVLILSLGLLQSSLLLRREADGLLMLSRHNSNVAINAKQSFSLIMRHIRALPKSLLYLSLFHKLALPKIKIKSPLLFVL